MKFFDFGFINSAGLSKVQLTWPLQLFSRRCSFFQNSNSVLNIFGYDWSNSHSFRNYCGKFVKSSFYMSKRTIRGDFASMKYLLLFLNDFGTWQTKLWTLAILAEKIWARSTKVFSASREEDFEDNLIFLLFIVFFFFPGFDRVDSWYYQKFPTCRQNCISCVTWNILKVNRIFSKQKFFFYQIGTLSGKRFGAYWFISAGLPKMLFLCPGNTLRKKNSAEVGTLLNIFWSLNRRKIWLQQIT